MSKSRDTPLEPVDPSVQPLNARSLALSALLGTHPPTLPAGSLVALAEVFGIQSGTMRTALSRLVASGDVTADAGRYTLVPRLVERQHAQDTGRRSPGRWDGSWHTAVAVAEQRELADRRQLRVVMANARFGELRPTVWMRPANLPAPTLDDDWVVTTGTVVGASNDRPVGALIRRLWDLRALAQRGERLHRRLTAFESGLDTGDAAAIPGAFTLSAEIVRFFRSDPLLPDQLTPPDWPIPRLRDRYDGFEHVLQTMMRPILTTEAASTSGDLRVKSTIQT